MTGWIEATYSMLRCDGEGHIIPHLTLSGDTDMVTAGVGSLSSVAANGIVMAEMTSDELRVGALGQFQSRINALLHRSDLRSVALRRVEEGATTAGLSFREFQKAYVSRRLVFACPVCEADAFAIRTGSITSFQREGGLLTVVADLELVDRPSD